MSPDVAGALMAMAGAQTRESALLWADTARREGATEAEVQTYIDQWDAVRASEVQTVQSQPTPAARCKCSHPPHGDLCSHRACGCKRHRPDTSPSVNESLRSKGELA